MGPYLTLLIYVHFEVAKVLDKVPKFVLLRLDLLITLLKSVTWIRTHQLLFFSFITGFFSPRPSTLISS